MRWLPGFWYGQLDGATMNLEREQRKKSELGESEGERGYAGGKFEFCLIESELAMRLLG